MRVAHIISNVHRGGAQLLLLDMLRQLKSKHDIESVVITIDSGMYIQDFQKEGVDVYDLRLKGLVNPLIFVKLSRALGKINPDIVHTHLLKADFYGRLTAYHSGVRMIVSTYHTNSTTHDSGTGLKRKLFDRIDRFVSNHTKSEIIAVSGFVQKSTAERLGRNISDIRLIYNGIDVERFESEMPQSEAGKLRNELVINKEEFVISLVGRLEESKGIHFFLDSVKELLTENNWKILLVGEGSEEGKIRKLISEFGLGGKVSLLGHRTDADRIIELSDLVCVPSVWEGFGLVVTEAMIKKKLVLASNAGGIPEIIEDGVNGFLFNILDKNMLCEKLMYIYKRRNDLEAVKETATVTVKAKFDIKKNTELYYQAYFDMLNALSKKKK